jgi:hypothetical protein
MFCVTELDLERCPEAAREWAAELAEGQTETDQQEQRDELAEWIDQAGALSLRGDGRRRRDEDEDEDEEEFEFEDEEEEEDDELWDDEFEDEEEEEDEDLDDYLDEEEEED